MYIKIKLYKKNLQGSKKKYTLYIISELVRWNFDTLK